MREEALEKGESQSVEFKETLEADSSTGERNPIVLKSALRTIAGFLNTNGGTLFIGISDSKGLVGLEKDLRMCNRHNNDGLEQKLRSLLATRFHSAPLGRVNIRFEQYQVKMICAIDVEMLPKTVAAWQERLQTGLKCAYNSFRGGRRLAVVFSNRLDCPSSNVALAKQETFRFEK